MCIVFVAQAESAAASARRAEQSRGERRSVGERNREEEEERGDAHTLISIIAARERHRFSLTAAAAVSRRTAYTAFSFSCVRTYILAYTVYVLYVYSAVCVYSTVCVCVYSCMQMCARAGGPVRAVLSGGPLSHAISFPAAQAAAAARGSATTHEKNRIIK